MEPSESQNLLDARGELSIHRSCPGESSPSMSLTYPRTHRNLPQSIVLFEEPPGRWMNLCS
jgi:hypothetical protein